MPLEAHETDVYECPSCGELWQRATVDCCGGTLEPVDVPAVYSPPEIDAVVKEVFDISSTELALCRLLMAEDEATIDDLARQFPRDRSNVSRHLNHLVELGVIDKSTRSLTDGGRVNVYAPRPIDEVRRRLLLGLYGWATDAENRLEELNQQKFQAMVEQADVESDDGSTRGPWNRAVERESVVGAASRDGDDRSVIARLLDRVRFR